MTKIPDAWSYSAYSVWKKCPHQYEGLKILKLPDPPSQALLDGRVFHDEVAHYITGQSGTLPQRPIHKRILPIVEELRTVEDKTVEMQWAHTNTWKPTAWFSRNPLKATWLRVVLDVGIAYPDHTAIVGDWKTGKRYDDNDEQMELFSLSTFAMWPHVQEVETRLWYVDNGHEEPAVFKKAEEAALRAKWEGRAREMLSDREWKPKPNAMCRFCVRSREAGGDCKFG